MDQDAVSPTNLGVPHAPGQGGQHRRPFPETPPPPPTPWKDWFGFAILSFSLWWKGDELGMAQAEGVPCPGAAPGQPCVFKLVLLGSGSVGKSSLALRYVKNDFKSILPTVGCAFFTKVVELGAVSLKFEIWDTAGQEKYHSICHLYFRGANAALLVYDITRKDSFCKAQQWLQDLERQVPAGEVVVMLVGNKTDLGEQREVTFQEGKEFAESKRLLFMEASAKLNHQVTEVFSALGPHPGVLRAIWRLLRLSEKVPDGFPGCPHFQAWSSSCSPPDPSQSLTHSTLGRCHVAGALPWEGLTSALPEDPCGWGVRQVCVLSRSGEPQAPSSLN
ncbi:ras-related protein Rab-17 isoform X1 [Canis lupus familiaris]|uniref:ras-related protein Rab-17 isoform X1 n=1 Tax=Canis lupus familiaris TaxID=9615 RepID=UPI0018F3E6F3|nr:ras-related protein Rab-17 isoform X1 [Canis lupus familiaris]